MLSMDSRLRGNDGGYCFTTSHAASRLCTR
jgi:hypothetical protein